MRSSELALQTEKPKLVVVSMERNLYMGSWRLGSVLVTNRIAMLPRSDTTQMKVKGREPDTDSFQPWAAQKEKCDWCGAGLERHDVLLLACREKNISKKPRQEM